MKMDLTTTPPPSRLSRISRDLKHLLVKDERAGSLFAILLGQITLFFLPFSLQKTQFFSKHTSVYGDEIAESEILFTSLTCASFLHFSKKISRRFKLRRWYGIKGNYIANLVFSFLAIFVEKFYEKSIASLFLLLNISILILILLVIMRSWTDFGSFGFIMGAFGSIAYNLFGLKLPVWVIISVIVLFGFKCWLDQNWFEEDELSSSSRRNHQMSTDRDESRPWKRGMFAYVERTILILLCGIWLYSFYGRLYIADLSFPYGIFAPSTRSELETLKTPNILMSCIWLIIMSLFNFIFWVVIYVVVFLSGVVPSGVCLGCVFMFSYIFGYPMPRF